ncbi:hypothetical protein EUGRSUZ_F01199 [Eucalyptus grandis]|uniref:Uncharacterized protein n=2 Tax=Eucalyptus grandis TaxID=71139 RepID=A0ACC3KFV7_EUCGR|nr:hypothetical protein EUGRSUZ_F01199 [Eucalyptus grandis]
MSILMLIKFSRGPAKQVMMRRLQKYYLHLPHYRFCSSLPWKRWALLPDGKATYPVILTQLEREDGNSIYLFVLFFVSMHLF